MSNQLWIGNDNLLILDELKDEHPDVDDYVNNATVTATLYDDEGNAVSGANGISLSYITGSDGKYVGVLEDDLSLTRYDDYTATVSVDAGSDKIAEFNLEVYADEREDS